MKNSKKQQWGILAGGAVIVLAVVYYFFVSPRPEPPKEAPKAPVVEKKVEPPPLEPIDLDLDQSDATVRKLVAGLSSRPELAQWLVTDNVVRKFVTAVDNIAIGESPRRQIDFFMPNDDFLAVKTKDGRYNIDPNSYKRYDLIATVFTSLDAEGFATLYRRLKPTIEKAYKEMGYPDEDFDNTMRKAISEMLAVPVVGGNIGLKDKVLSFKMTNPDLENLTPAQKHLLRMGPKNVQAIQAKLREIAADLGFSE